MKPTDAVEIARKIVEEYMLGKDAFSLWLGISLVEVRPGNCALQCTIREDMLNGFFIAHGGIAYSVADSALAFASNGHNNQAVSVETSISHTKKLKAGDVITAVCEEKNLSTRFGQYQVTVTNQDNEIVALFTGTVYRTGKKWIE